MIKYNYMTSSFSTGKYVGGSESNAEYIFFIKTINR